MYSIYAVSVGRASYRPVNIENVNRPRAINIFYPGISPHRGDFMPELNVHGSKALKERP